MGKYDLDFHAWAFEQADIIRRRSSNEIDWDNVAEELASLGRQEESDLGNRYDVLLTHLLKWMFQPERRGRSWEGTIREQRKRIAKLFRKNPSLKSVDDEEFFDAYGIARYSAVRETDLPEETFPEAPPFTAAEAKDDAFWPGPV